jgi:hypothetical protein
MTGDHQVVRADDETTAFKVGTDIAVMSRSILIEGQHLKAGSQSLDFMALFRGVVRLGGAVQQLCQRDRRNAKAVRLSVEPYPSARLSVTKNAVADVGIEHEAAHQNASRF